MTKSAEQRDVPTTVHEDLSFNVSIQNSKSSSI